MKNNTKNILIVSASALISTATFAIGYIAGHKKQKPLKISGTLNMVYHNGVKDPIMGLLINDIKDLNSKYIVLEVVKCVDNEEDCEKVNGNA